MEKQSLSIGRRSASVNAIWAEARNSRLTEQSGPNSAVAGQYGEAESIYRKALQINQNLLGAKHSKGGYHTSQPG